MIQRPYVTITLRHSSDSNIILIIKNTGKTNAIDLKLSIDRNIYQLDLQSDEYDIAKLYLFKNIIHTFPPEAEMTFPIISSIAVQSEDPKNTIKEPVFTLTATYSFFNKRVTEKTTIDLLSYQGIWMPEPTVEDRLEQLKDEIKLLREFLQKKLAP